MIDFYKKEGFKTKMLEMDKMIEMIDRLWGLVDFGRFKELGKSLMMRRNDKENSIHDRHKVVGGN